MVYRGFCGPSYTSQSVIADAELCMNWYPEQMESDAAPSRDVLYPTPGVLPYASSSIG